MIANRHLPQRLDCQVVAHRMRKNGDRFDIRIGRQRLQDRLKRVARIHRAVAIVDVVDDVAARGPGEQHRRHIDPRVVNDLGEPIDGFLEAGVVAVHENEDLASRRAAHARVEIGFRPGQIDAVGAQSDEVVFRIAGRPRRPLHFAASARRVGWHRHHDVGELEPSAARAAEHDARRIDDRRARRRNENVDSGSARRAGSDDKVAEWTGGTAGDQRRQDKRQEGAGAPPLVMTIGASAFQLETLAMNMDATDSARARCPGRAVRTKPIGASSMPCFTGSGLWFWLTNHQTATRTMTISRMIAHIGNPPLLGVAGGGAGVGAARAVAAGAGAGRAAAALRPPRPANNPVALSARDTSAGSAAEIAVFCSLSIAAIEERSDQFEGSCWPIAPTAACATAPIADCAAPVGAPAYWLRAPARFDSPEPPSRPPSRFAPWSRAPTLPPLIAAESLVRRSGSEFATASASFWAPPGADAIVTREARTVGIAEATSFCATASLTPTARARPPTSWGVRIRETRLTRSTAIGHPLQPRSATGARPDQNDLVSLAARRSES